MAIALSYMVFELSLSSVLMRIKARGALVRHGHSGQIHLGIPDARVLNHITLRNIFLSTKSRTPRVWGVCVGY